jgi:site-specific recombinase XerD
VNVQNESEKQKLFLNSIKSKETRNSYEILFQKYADFMGKNDLFCENNPRLIEQKIIDFIMFLRDSGKSYSAIRNYIVPIKSFYKINDIVLNDTIISKFLPEQKRSRKDRAYNYEEISKLLEMADERMRVIILLLASSGIRLGALPLLRLHNLEDTKLTVYENAREEYFTFITLECKKAIDSYLDMRSRYGEKLTDNSYLIREQFDIRDQFAARKPKQITHKSIQWKLITLAERCGIRKREYAGDKKISTIRHDVMIAHGFRKFFTTKLVKAKVNAEVREMLLGHKIGLASCYYKPTEDEMFDEYEKAIDLLTINEENRLRKKVEMLMMEESKADLALSAVEDMKKQLGLT